ncbi:uncharacterized protein IWZ02DRAFT_516088 [Phyllosticta citriasiana]|uniref:uncharacterized protein n=1 Tax=Phyllosticta citriasiana TaxID=595635 RepID=UPI0030FDE658
MDTADRPLTSEEEATLDEIKLPYYSCAIKALARSFCRQYFSCTEAQEDLEKLRVPHSGFGGPSKLCGLQMIDSMGEEMVKEQVKMHNSCQELSARMIKTIHEVPEALRKQVVIYYWRHIQTWFGPEWSKWPKDLSILRVIKSSILQMGSEANVLAASLEDVIGSHKSSPSTPDHGDCWTPSEQAESKSTGDLLEEVVNQQVRSESAPGVLFKSQEGGVPVVPYRGEALKDTGVQTTAESAPEPADNTNGETTMQTTAGEPKPNIDPITQGTDQQAEPGLGPEAEETPSKQNHEPSLPMWKPSPLMVRSQRYLEPSHDPTTETEGPPSTVEGPSSALLSLERHLDSNAGTDAGPDKNPEDSGGAPKWPWDYPEGSIERRRAIKRMPNWRREG